MTPSPSSGSFHDFAFHGPMGALTSSGDLVLETRAWREKLFAARAEQRVDPLTPFWRGLTDRIQGFMFPGGMMGGGSLALNQLLVQMDGVDEPPFKKQLLHAPAEHPARRDLRHPRADRQGPAAPDAAQAALGADLLHRRHERAPRSPRSGADQAGTDGPPHLVSDALQGRPQTMGNQDASVILVLDPLPTDS